MRGKQIKLLGLLILGLSWNGCAHLRKGEGESPKAAEEMEKGRDAGIEDSPVTATDLDHGYSLLIKLLGDEKDVSKLLIIKRENRDLRELISRISQVCKEGHDYLKGTAAASPAQGMPKVELACRKIISRQRAVGLLTDRGKDFELLLLLSQNEALTYGAALAEAVAKSEPNALKQMWLMEYSQRLAALQKSVYAKLHSTYQWSRQR